MRRPRPSSPPSDVRRRGTCAAAGGDRAAQYRCRPATTTRPCATARPQRRVAELDSLDGADSAEAIAPNWRLQLGSLGSGNHFIEVSLDEDDRVWLFLHSGSRGVGNKLATKHIKVAREQCREAVDQPARPGPGLPGRRRPRVLGLPAGPALGAALRLAEPRGDDAPRPQCRAGLAGDEETGCLEAIECHHNYTVQETHFGKKVWLSRKGAIDASAGMAGLIPGSMGTRSYVVTGKGNPLVAELLTARRRARVLPVGSAQAVHPRRARCARWTASSGAEPTPSWTRSRPRTRTSMW